MTDVIVSVGYGKENFSTQSASIAVFNVMPDFKREFPSKVFRRQGGLQRYPASQYPEVNGYLFLESMVVPEGAILCIQASHRYRGSPIRDGAVFVRVRNDGPTLLIKAKLPANAEALVSGDFLVFQGKADLMGLDDLAVYGVFPPNNWSGAFLDSEEVLECFIIDEIAKESAPRLAVERVETSDGEAVIVAKRRTRRLNFR